MINIPGYVSAGKGYSKVGDVVVIELKSQRRGNMVYAGQAVGVYPLLFGGTLLRKISKKEVLSQLSTNKRSTQRAKPRSARA